MSDLAYKIATAAFVVVWGSFVLALGITGIVLTVFG